MKENVNVMSNKFGKINPTSVSEFVELGGFDGLKKAVGMNAVEVIEEVKKANLFGRGGAAYPTGLKWEQAYAIKTFPKYIVCNADEGEPGTFKDRQILSEDPMQLIEGMIIAGYVMGSNEGFIYIRGEYTSIQQIVKIAIENVKKAGYLGSNILGKGFDFEIKVISGAGAYVCGENTALVESIEGKAGRPRKKPPYIKNCGLRQMPTLLNNVETFSAIPYILKEGGDKFASIGTPISGGTKLVCLSGNISNRGTYEVPFGTTLREIIYELGGGVPNGRKLKFVHMGGCSGTCFTESQMDTILCYDDLKKNGMTLGSGAIVVVDDSNCVVDYVKTVIEFFKEESCGKCSPCREGTKVIYQFLENLTNGKATMNDFQKIKSLIATIKVVSFCGLGQSIPVAITSLLKYFEEEFVQHIEGKCTSNICAVGIKKSKVRATKDSNIAKVKSREEIEEFVELVDVIPTVKRNN